MISSNKSNHVVDGLSDGSLIIISFPKKDSPSYELLSLENYKSLPLTSKQAVQLTMNYMERNSLEISSFLLNCWEMDYIIPKEFNHSQEKCLKFPSQTILQMKENSKEG